MFIETAVHLANAAGMCIQAIDPAADMITLSGQTTVRLTPVGGIVVEGQGAAALWTALASVLEEGRYPGTLLVASVALARSWGSRN